MSVVDDIKRLLAETPHYMSHVTVSRPILERLVEMLEEAQKKLEEKK